MVGIAAGSAHIVAPWAASTGQALFLFSCLLAAWKHSSRRSKTASQPLARVGALCGLTLAWSAWGQLPCVAAATAVLAASRQRRSSAASSLDPGRLHFS
eukprot:12739215-Alexandrium_andersonii.AAC.1